MIDKTNRMHAFLIILLTITNLLASVSIYAATNFNLSKEKYEDFPVHEFAKSPLRDLKVPDNWQLFKDPLELYRFHDRFKGPVHEKHLIDTWKMEEYVEDCVRALSEFDLKWHKYDMPMRFIRCKTVMTQFHFRDREAGIKGFEKILLSWAKNKPVLYKTVSKNEADDQAYASSMMVGDLSSFYAIYYKDFNFSKEQRKIVDEYLSDWLINHDLNPEPGKVRCNLEKPEIFEKLNDYTFDNDYCGSNRWRVGLGAVYLGLRTGNQKLFTAGNRHIEINLATIDKDGIFPSWARKGALALSYQRQLPEVLTLLAVAYETIGYDFYEHQLPHGKKIHQVYETLFDFIYHPEKLNKYAFARPNYNGEDVYAFDKLPLSEKWKREIIDLEVLATQSKGYVLRYRPDLEDKINYTERWDQKFGTWKDHIAVFVSISGVAIYEAANQNVSKIIIEETIKKIKLENLKKKLLAKEAEEKAAREAEEKAAREAEEKKSAERIKAIIKKEKEKKIVREKACKASIYNGEYTVEWFFGNVNNNQKLEYQGSETLVLAKCTGKFDGEKDFQPTKELRKKLKVNYQPNGTIHVAGRLDLFEKGDMEGEIELKGDINIGEASGKTRAGDLIKIVIVKKAQRSTLFDGQYKFNLFRSFDQESMKIGSGYITIKDGEIIINNQERFLNTGSKNLYDSLDAQVDENGIVTGYIEMDILGSKERTEYYNFKGEINKKIWGTSPDEEDFKIYIKFE